MADERASLRRVAAAVVTGADPTAALCIAAQEVASLMEAEQGFVFRFMGDQVIIAGVSGIEASPVGAAHEVLATGVIPQVFHTRAPARVEGVRRPLGRENSRQHWISPVYRGGIGAPVFVGEQLWGALVAGTIRDEPFPSGAEERLAYFAEIAGIAIGHAEANARLARLAMSDPLTELANHRTFHSALAGECERSRRHGRRLALAVIDVDHFKAVNDLHGHTAGDRALIEVARRLGTVSRSADILGRVGGEEFAWILPETSLEGALTVADRARRAIAEEPIPGVGAVTVSIGVAELVGATTATDLYRQADDALYRAKRSGRNRTRAHDGRPLPAGAPDPDDPSPTAVMARALARAMGARDAAARDHCERAAEMAGRLARAAGWSDARRARLVDAALIHDVGGPGGGCDAAALGGDIAAEALSAEQAAWIRGHRERWDGSGGPDGHRGEAIPDGARLIAVADRWDELRGRPRDAALAEIRRESGSRFCPGAVAALIAAVDGDEGHP